MQLGVLVLSIKRDAHTNEWSISVIGKFEEGNWQQNKRLAYAASASPVVDGDGRGRLDVREREKGTLCISAGFYDERVYGWVWMDGGEWEVEDRQDRMDGKEKGGVVKSE
jgi:hypothetical protein